MMLITIHGLRWIIDFPYLEPMKEKIQKWLAARPDLKWAALLFILAFLQYANTINHQYAWDDDIVILQNHRVQKGLAAIPGHFEFRTRENFEDFTGYRPVTMTSFSIDVALFDLNPKAGHLINILLFALLCVVLFRTMRHLFPNYHAAFAFFITLLYIVHPLHVEAVANIKSRDEILALLFALLSLQFFIKHYRSGKWAQLGLSAFFLLLGALSKEGALTFFAIIPMTVVILLEGDWRRKLTGLIKFPLILLIILGVFFLLTGAPPGTPTPVATKGFLESQTLGNCMAVEIADPWQRIGNVSFLFGKNVEKFFYPKDLVYFSGYNMYPIKDWTADRIPLAISFMIPVVMLAFSMAFWSRAKPFIYGFWFFFFTVIIYLQWPRFLLADTIADRYMFIPSVGLCILTIYALYQLLGLDPGQNPLEAIRSKARQISKSIKVRSIAFCAVLLITTLNLTSLTFTRNQVWKDNLTLFSHDLPYLENCARAHYYYASELAKGYDQSPNPAQTKAEIIRHYRRAIEITPESYYAFVRLAANYQRWGDYAAQTKLCDQALQFYPGQADLWHLKGMAHYYLAEYTEAAKAFEDARLRAPELDDNWEFLARSQERAGNFEAAISTLNEALNRNASYYFYYDVLSDTYFDAGDTAKSFEPILTLLERDGQNPVWWRKIIGRYQMIGNQEAASHYYQQAQQRGISLQ
jgi:protein O-mannosyl-transferase